MVRYNTSQCEPQISRRPYRMAQARCTLRVHGLDCPGEVPPIRAALEGSPGVLDLLFDPVAGSVAVDYDTSLVEPLALANRVSQKSGMRAEVALAVIEPEPRSISKWLPTIGSGVKLGISDGRG